jgi:DNA-binding FadR family transcriptional regulator
MFGIARNSVREAVKIFHYLGVLESQTGRGTYVGDRAKISSEALTWSILLGENDFLELIQLRAALEQFGLRSLVETYRQSPQKAAGVLSQLEKEVENIKAAVEAQDLEALILADYGFHGAIIAASNNSLFTAIYRTLRAFMHEEIKSSLQNVNMQKSIREHKEFIETIKTGDVEKALEVHRKHIRWISDKLRGMPMR